MSGVAKPTARNLQILALAESGLTFRAIGAKFGMSSERVRQIVRDLGGTAKWAEAKKARSEARQRHTKRDWYRRNAEKIAARARKWRQENLAAVREKERAYTKARYASDPEFRQKCLLRFKRYAASERGRERCREHQRQYRARKAARASRN